jgi:hypothetical protein
LNLIPACPFKVEDTDDSENYNAQGPHVWVSPAGQFQEEEVGAVLKNMLY